MSSASTQTSIMIDPGTSVTISFISEGLHSTPGIKSNAASSRPFYDLVNTYPSTQSHDIQSNSAPHYFDETFRHSALSQKPPMTPVNKSTSSRISSRSTGPLKLFSPALSPIRSSDQTEHIDDTNAGMLNESYKYDVTPQKYTKSPNTRYGNSTQYDQLISNGNRNVTLSPPSHNSKSLIYYDMQSHPTNQSIYNRKHEKVRDTQENSRQNSVKMEQQPHLDLSVEGEAVVERRGGDDGPLDDDIKHRKNVDEEEEEEAQENHPMSLLEEVEYIGDATLGNATLHSISLLDQDHFNFSSSRQTEYSDQRQQQRHNRGTAEKNFSSSVPPMFKGNRRREIRPSGSHASNDNYNVTHSHKNSVLLVPSRRVQYDDMLRGGDEEEYMDYNPNDRDSNNEYDYNNEADEADADEVEWTSHHARKHFSPKYSNEPIGHQYRSPDRYDSRRRDESHHNPVHLSTPPRLPHHRHVYGTSAGKSSLSQSVDRSMFQISSRQLRIDRRKIELNSPHGMQSSSFWRKRLHSRDSHSVFMRDMEV